MNMQLWSRAGVVVIGCVLAACGSEAPQKGAATPAARQASATTPTGNATAAQVAAEARGRIKCPAKPQSAARPAGAPVDDVVGVRPGLTYDEAMHVVLCTHDLLVANPDPSRRFQIQTYGQELRQGFVARFAKERVQKSSQEILREMQDNAMARGSNRAVRDIHPGEAKWYVATMGMPGKERVIHAAREEWFEAGRQPTAASIEQALTTKYGPPTHRQHHSNSPRFLTWAYDLRQRPITESSPLYGQCRSNASPDAGTSYSPDCGVIVSAAINPLRDNPELAENLQVSVIDQAGGYEALHVTEQGLQEMEAQRRARQVQEASSNATAPTL